MKRLFIFIFLSINIFANMHEPSPPHATNRHHHKHYMKKLYNKDDLTPEQKNKIELLRIDFIHQDRRIDSQLRRVRRDMNTCMRSDRADKDDEYKRLRSERERLREEKKILKKDYKDKFSEILKKQ